MNEARIARLLTLITLVALLSGIRPLPVVSTSSSWGGPDFAWCIAVLQAYWRGEIPEPYSYESLRFVMRETFGVESTVVIPIAYSPAMIWLLRPFGWMSGFIDPTLAWNLFSWLLLSIVLLQPGLMTLRPAHLAALALLISPASFESLALGQTAHFGAALLVVLTAPSRTAHGVAIKGGAIFLLSLKPTYFALGVLLSILTMRPRQILGTLGLLGCATCALLLVLPELAWRSWLTNLSFFTNGSDNRLLTPGIIAAFERTLTLRSLLESVFTNEIAWKASIILLISLVSGFLLLMMHLTKNGQLQSSLQMRLWVQSALVSLFLISLPYLGYYEEILLIAFLLPLGPIQTAATIPLLVGYVAMLCPSFLPKLSPIYLTLLKCTGVAMLLTAAYPSRRRRDSSALRGDR